MNRDLGPEDFTSTSLTDGFESDVKEVLPRDCELSAAYPNPFNPSTTFTLSLPQMAEVSVSVFNIAGQQVATLADGQLNAGQHSLTFNAQDLASGMYFVRATVQGELIQLRKVMLVR